MYRFRLNGRPVHVQKDGFKYVVQVSDSYKFEANSIKDVFLMLMSKLGGKVLDSEDVSVRALQRAAEDSKDDRVVYMGKIPVKIFHGTQTTPPTFEVFGHGFDSAEGAANYVSSINNGVADDLQERKVGDKMYKVKEFPNAEEADKFLEENAGYAVIDEENGKIYVALSSDRGI